MHDCDPRPRRRSHPASPALPPGHPLGGADGRFSYASRWVGLGDLAFLDRVHSLIGQLELVAAAAVYVSYPQGTPLTAGPWGQSLGRGSDPPLPPGVNL